LLSEIIPNNLIDGVIKKDLYVENTDVFDTESLAYLQFYDTFTRALNMVTPLKK